MTEDVVLRIFPHVQSTALGNKVVPEAMRGLNFLTDSVLTDQPPLPTTVVVGIFVVNVRFLRKELAFSGVNEIHKTSSSIWLCIGT